MGHGRLACAAQHQGLQRGRKERTLVSGLQDCWVSLLLATMTPWSTSLEHLPWSTSPGAPPWSTSPWSTSPGAPPPRGTSLEHLSGAPPQEHLSWGTSPGALPWSTSPEHLPWSTSTPSPLAASKWVDAGQEDAGEALGGGRSQAQPGFPGLTHRLGMAPRPPDPGSLPARRTLVPGWVGVGAPTPLAGSSALPVSVRRPPPPVTGGSPGLREGEDGRQSHGAGRLPPSLSCSKPHAPFLTDS